MSGPIKKQIPDLDGYAQAPVELPEVRILRLEPGDVLLLMSPHRLSDAEVDEIRTRVGVVFPDHRMALLGDGMTLDILRKGGEQ